VDDQQGFDVRQVGFGADGIEVALHELAKPPALRTFAPPDRADVIPFEGRADFVEMLGRVPGQGHGQVEPQRHIAVALVHEAEQLLVGLFPAFAQEDFRVLERRRVNRAEAIAAVNRAGGVHQGFAGHHLIGQMIAKPAQRAGRNQGVFGHGDID
jgi:hypothetical protein